MIQIPRGDRLHITIFGRRNSGKSSLINALTHQDIAITSDIPGTTTDLVSKTMEIAPIGPVVITDTAGLDDEGELGAKRIQRSLKALESTDIGVLVVDAREVPGEWEQELLSRCFENNSRCVLAINKIDLASGRVWQQWAADQKIASVDVCAVTGQGIAALQGSIIAAAPAGFGEIPLMRDLVSAGDIVILVTPIDQSAPKGRMILPQVMTIRDALDTHAVCVVCQARELRHIFESLAVLPKLIITDSQAFMKVVEDTPAGTPLTSFSILMARYHGDLEGFVIGAQKIDLLRPGSRVLIAEACTHHQQPDDIGKVQIPNSLQQYVGGDLDIGYANGRDFPIDVSTYDLIVHCGGCMMTRRELLWRQHQAKEAAVPMTNYGVALAKVHGILNRALEPFPNIQKTLA